MSRVSITEVCGTPYTLVLENIDWSRESLFAGEYASHMTTTVYRSDFHDG
jgi:hypothetical protein